jgi:aryl-alcohol dehydrogenase-like predicted oxidoreductase
MKRELGLGCMGMSEFYGATDDAQSLATLEAAFDAGVRHFDTADSYGAGHNEELLGRFIKGKRAQLRIATKFGIVREPGRYERRIDNSPGYIRSACEASLRRLGVDHIDLFYVHRLDPSASLEETIGTLAELKREGKIGAIGLCEVSPQTLRRAAALHPIASLQSEYSLWTRDPEAGALAAVRDIGAQFHAYSPLGRGFLTGAIPRGAEFTPGDFRKLSPRFAAENLEANMLIAETVRALAASKGCTPAQLALAWLLAQGPEIVPIPGTKRTSYLLENLGALAVVLDDEELARIDEALPPGAAAGDRYPAAGMQGLNS